ncbi:MAG TPA: sigma 54-interacting transcriptional regulator, partial [Kofleriaceae bacterium]|nr:sigma 54-interacting transcriptional regulator [Kofleriaceae bacterium]
QIRVRQTYLVVLLDDRAVQLLPSTGRVSIGRATDAQVVIQHPSVSREHAVLDVEQLTLTDVGSRNGTYVGGQRITPNTPIHLGRGETIVVGEVTMFVQQDGASAPALAAPIPDAPLELRLVDETARAARHGSPFVHVRVHVPEPQADAAREVLADALRSSDVMSEEAPGRFQLLLPAITSERGRPVIQRLVQTLDRSGIEARTGIACWPQDGVTAAQLSAHARELVAAKARNASPMDEVMRLAASVASTEITVLITGETGVGKELIAEMIHRLSPRSQAPFMRINCAAIAEPLLESELFGHAKGSFTGADSARIGLFEAGAGGTVLLDEIGEMSLRIQATLLRVLEERVVRRVGETEPRPVDVRILCATNRNLQDEVNAGRFRRDLYYRISGMTIAIPPLRERRDAIEAIARAFAALSAARARRVPPTFTDEAIQALRSYPWPGNIRELRNSIERAVLLAGAGPIRPQELGLAADYSPEAPTPSVGVPTVPKPDERTGPYGSERPTMDSRDLSVEVAELERRRIVEALDRFGGNQTRAARALGMSRTTLVARMEAYALRRPRK